MPSATGYIGAERRRFAQQPGALVRIQPGRNLQHQCLDACSVRRGGARPAHPDGHWAAPNLARLGCDRRRPPPPARPPPGRTRQVSAVRPASCPQRRRGRPGKSSARCRNAPTHSVRWPHAVEASVDAVFNCSMSKWGLRRPARDHHDQSKHRNGSPAADRFNNITSSTVLGARRAHPDFDLLHRCFCRCSCQSGINHALHAAATCPGGKRSSPHPGEWSSPRLTIRTKQSSIRAAPGASLNIRSVLSVRSPASNRQTEAGLASWLDRFRRR